MHNLYKNRLKSTLLLLTFKKIGANIKNNQNTSYFFKFMSENVFISFI